MKAPDNLVFLLDCDLPALLKTTGGIDHTQETT